MTNQNDNVVEFKKKDPPKGVSHMIFELTMYEDADGQYEVYMEIDDVYEDKEIMAAMYAATMKFAVEHDLLESDEDDGNTSPEPANSDNPYGY